MGILYLFQFTVEYRGLSQPELFRIWVKEAEAVMSSSKGSGGVLKQIWKIVGERKVYAVLEVETPEQADALSIDLPIMKEFGDQVQIEVTPLITYESFANEMNRCLGNDVVYSAEDAPTIDGLYYWITVKVNHDGIEQEKLLRIWTEEAAAAISAKRKGKVVNLWKSVIKKEVHVLACMQSPEDVDKLSLHLPLFKKMGDKVSVECKSLRSYEGFYQDMKKRLSETDLSK